MPTARVQPAREACLEGPPAAGLGSRGGRDAGSPSAASLRKRSGRVARGRPQMWGREGIPCVLLLPRERLAPPKPAEAGMFLLATSSGFAGVFGTQQVDCLFESVVGRL